jgi:hypothetical protein
MGSRAPPLMSLLDRNVILCTWQFYADYVIPSRPCGESGGMRLHRKATTVCLISTPSNGYWVLAGASCFKMSSLEEYSQGEPPTTMRDGLDERCGNENDMAAPYISPIFSELRRFAQKVSRFRPRQPSTCLFISTTVPQHLLRLYLSVVMFI